ncbi:MAG: Mur ligase family protein [Parvularculaceae bacterium]
MQALVGRVTDRRLVTYGTNPQADVRAENISFEAGGSKFDILFRSRDKGERRIDGLRLPMPGVHNVLNATAAAIVAAKNRRERWIHRNGLAKFAGVKRRFTRVGEWGGVVGIDDYGHHPVEIAAKILRAARNVTRAENHRGRAAPIAIRACAICWTSSVPASMKPISPLSAMSALTTIDGIDRDAFVAGAAAQGHRDVRAISDFDDLPEQIAAIAEKGDYVVMLGAGDITKYAAGLAGELEKLKA